MADTSRLARARLLVGILIATLAATITPSYGARALGVDVSHHQAATGISQANWNQLAAEGRSFAFIKATEGLNPPGNVDFTWPTNVQRAQNAGILPGVYHFARPDNRPNVAGAIAEAGHFVATAGSAMEPGHLRPVLDLEVKHVDQTSATLTDWTLAFVDEVVRLKGPGAEPIIYLSTSFASFLDPRVANLDAWIRSINGQDPLTGQPSSTGRFSTWAFWQYQVGSAGGLSPLDLNVQNSDVQPLSAFVIPEPGAATLTAMVVVSVLSRRRRCCRRRCR